MIFLPPWVGGRLVGPLNQWRIILKERVHSEMKISLVKKAILGIVPIRLISFCLFYFSGQKCYGKICRSVSANAGPGSDNAGHESIMPPLVEISVKSNTHYHIKHCSHQVLCHS